MRGSVPITYLHLSSWCSCWYYRKSCVFLKTHYISKRFKSGKIIFLSFCPLLLVFFFLPGTNFYKSQANSLQTITHYKAKDDLEILMPLASLSRANTQAPISTLIYAVLLIQHGVSYAKQALYHLRNISIPILVKLDNILKPKF